jgi:nucleoside-diphosphate-sugar epimerase
MPNEKLLVTGATGMVGSFVARRAIESGYDVRLLVRPNSDRSLLEGVDAEYVEGDLGDYDSLPAALAGVDVVVHSGAHIGDWGPAEKYRAINVVGLEHMLTAVERERRIRRWIQVSSLGVYPARHHYGTDETTPADLTGLDGYTRTKAEAEVLVNQHIERFQLPAVIVRPGFIYGPGERHVIPRLIQKFESGVVKFIGDPNKVLNNTYVGNLVDAIFLAIDRENALGRTYNVRDERLVTREEYLMTFADYLGKPRPARVPLWLARTAAPLMEGWARMRGATQPPLLTKAAIKFMALNLDFSIERAKRELGYEPRVDFQEGMREALDWATGKSRELRESRAHANR